MCDMVRIYCDPYHISLLGVKDLVDYGLKMW